MARKAKAVKMVLPNKAALDISAKGFGAELRMQDQAVVLWVEERDEDAPPLKGRPKDDTVRLVIEHPLENAKHVFVPQLCPEPGDVMGDRIFRAPAIVVSNHEVAIAIIVDVDDLYMPISYRTWLDYDHPARTITFGVGQYREKGHVFYERAPSERYEAHDAFEVRRIRRHGRLRVLLLPPAIPHPGRGHAEGVLEMRGMAARHDVEAVLHAFAGPSRTTRDGPTACGSPCASKAIRRSRRARRCASST